MDYNSVIINGIEYKVGEKCTYENCWAKVTGIIKFGEWKQYVGDGEYNVSCYGYYVEVIDLEPGEWSNDTKEEVEEYYPFYAKTESLIDLIRNAINFKLIK